MASRNLKDEKHTLRTKVRKVLGSLKEESINDQSILVTKKIVAMPEYQNARSLSIFLSMPGKEVSTTDIVIDALRKGKKVFIPYIHASQKNPKMKIMDMLRLENEQDLRNLIPDAWGIPSLSRDDIDHRENAMGGTGLNSMQDLFNAVSTLDVIFLPGVAFDFQNNRLGHGKGFYDRYLSELDALRKESGQNIPFPKLIGLALREQLLADKEKIPTSDDDWKIERLVLAD